MAPTEIAVTFDDMTVLSEGGVDVFVLNWNGEDDPPPYYIDVGDRLVMCNAYPLELGANMGTRFAFSATTFQVNGHGPVLASHLLEQEAEGLTPLLVERDDRFYLYLHDPNAEALEHEGADEPDEVNEADGESDAE